jgi:predicted outer membrane protein
MKCTLTPGLVILLAALTELAPAAEKPAADESAVSRPTFDLVVDVEPADIVLARQEHKGLLAAAKDLQRDITKITGVTPNIVHSLERALGQVRRARQRGLPEGKALLASVGVDVDDLAGKWESSSTAC